MYFGPVELTGSQTSGSGLGYRFDAQALTQDTLIIHAKIKAKGWKAKFPPLTISDLPQGLTTNVPGTAIHIPADVTGPATIKLKARYGTKRVGKITFSIVIGVPPPAPTNVSTNLYDVGFDTLVSLDGSIVPTTGLVSPLVYEWSQTAGKPVMLSATDVITTTFTTDPLTNFVDLAGLFHSNRVSVVGLDSEHVHESTYTFQLLVSDGSLTRTGIFTVACASIAAGHRNIPVGVHAYVVGDLTSTNWTLLARPEGSLASLTHANSLSPGLRPDVGGNYLIHDNVSGTNVLLTAAQYVGGFYCVTCHGPGNEAGNPDVVTPWSGTRHASKFSRGIDGLVSPSYKESCIKCHTVGYNPAVLANNGGFDDIQRELGWVFPNALKPGNSELVPDALQARANIQCESCHGPGNRHPGEKSVSLDYRVCAQCHQDGNHHVRPQQWEISPHAEGYRSISERRGVRADCARCHSPVALIDLAKGLSDLTDTNRISTGVGALSCQTCHDPHDAFGEPDRHQLRVYDTFVFGNPYFRSNVVEVAMNDALTTADPRLTNSYVVVQNAGASAACMTCHNGRQWPTQVQVYGSNTGKMFYQTGGPHAQLAGEVFAGMGAYDYGQEMGNSYHPYLTDCQTCHMYQLKLGDTILVNEAPVLITKANLGTYENLVGNHTFSMKYLATDSNGLTNVVANIAACNQCHAGFDPVDRFDFRLADGGDYDGNGDVEGVQTETVGLLDHLGFLLGSTGVSITTNAAGHVTSVSTRTGYAANESLHEAQRKAAWNWLVGYREGSAGVHNTQYVIRLLQTSYTDLSTNWTGSVADTFKAVHPAADLR